MPRPEQGPPSPPRPSRAETDWPPVAREGWIIVAAFFLGAILISALGAWLFGTIGGFLAALFAIPLALWSFWFFRDPARRIPTEPGLIVSPADGVCCFAGPASPPAELGLPAADRRRISIFMNVFNVHVNRAPIAGTVERIEYRPGRYFNASLDKASEHNERSGMVLALADGRRLACVQIAGLVARRIVSRVQPGDRLTTGERYGLIRFGSRVDVYLPEGVEPLVKLGDRMVAGETIIGRLVPAPAPPPQVHIPAQTHTAIP